MNEITCPHCGKAFKIDEAGYADILKQVRDREFESDLHERLESAVELAQAKASVEMERETSKKDIEIERLKEELKSSTDLVIAKVTGEMKDAVNKKDAEIERLKAELVRPGARGAAHAAAQLDTWLLPDGLWVERRGADGVDLGGPAPASSLYHLTCALLMDPPALTAPPAIRTSTP